MGFSQSNIRLNNYWENTYYINPASIYSEYHSVASVAGRTQWIGFPGAPNTGFITATVRPYPKRHTQIGQFGLKAYFDKIGYTKRTYISFSYSYSVKLKKNLLMNLGAAGSFQNASYDMTKQNLETIGDPAIYNTMNNQSNFNPDFGVEFVSKSFLVGAASQNIISVLPKDNKLQTNTHFLYAMYREKTRNPVDFQYGICAIQNDNLTQFEFNITGFINSNNYSDLFHLGVSYRTMREYGVSFGIDLGKFGKKSSNTCQLACRYEYNFTNIRQNSFGTPEILLIMKFGILPDCKCRELYK